MKRQHHMPFGAAVAADEAVRFRLWAPSAKRVVLQAGTATGGKLQADLNEEKGGWFELAVAGLGARTTYNYRIDDAVDVPDPASRFNPDGVLGPSVVVDPGAFEWNDDDWRGREWHESVIYELHVGTFTREGTFASTAARLDELADLGITTLELMPLAAFAGKRGWGYDGVLPYAPHAAYGQPEDLKRLIQAAHERRLSVLLDVVYNHFGPEGNYLARYARDFFSASHQTPWGDAINFSHPVVRQFFIQNALYWLNEYHFDGLRIDAVHAMHDDSARHFIDELIDEVRRGPGRERHVHVVLENHHNEARRLRREASGSRVSVAQWNDDFHHPLHVILSGEVDGYYCDYADQPIEQLGRVLSQGFAFQGERSAFSGEQRGEPSADLPPTAFVDFLQNHDQIGNRAFGERLGALIRRAPDAERAAACADAALAILLLSPHMPMLFMGEEYGAAQPFLYFCDFKGELAEAVRNGRRNEFAAFSAFTDERVRQTIPDPNAASTFESSCLVHEDRKRSPHAERLRYTRELIRVRSQHVVPLIRDILPGKSTHELSGQLLTVRWPTALGSTLVLQANPGAKKTDGAVPGELLFPARAAGTGTLAAWDVRLLLQKS